MVNDREPWTWRVRRWAAPVAMALSVTASVGAVQLLADQHFSTSYGDYREPRYLVTVGRTGASSREGGSAPWLQVRALGEGGRPRPVDTVPPPSSSAGEAHEVLAGPNGTFLVVSFREKPCESRLYRFRLREDGRVSEVETLDGEVVPSRVAGLAMSPDGDRIAYTTAPCGDEARPRANVTVLDIASGSRRTWSTTGPSIVGEIVWAGDNRTLGYTISDIEPTGQVDELGRGMGRGIENVTVHALDTDVKGIDVRTDNVLFRQSDGSVNVATAIMGPDGRGGFGMLKKGEPPSTIFFTFREGEPIHVTKTIPAKSNSRSMLAVAAVHENPRYACLNGIDSFGRASSGQFRTFSYGHHYCDSAFAY